MGAVVVVWVQQMSGYTQIIKELLGEQYKDRSADTIIISTFNIKFIPPKAQLLLQTYSHLRTLAITKCDLRKLENFPVLPQLLHLDLSNNSLQGTLNYLMPLRSLQYLNIAHNIISDYRELEPLRRLRRLEVYLDDNPFLELPSWKYKIRMFGIVLLKTAKQLGRQQQPEEVEQGQKEKEKEVAEEQKQKGERQGGGHEGKGGRQEGKQGGRQERSERRTFNFASYRQRMMANMQGLQVNQEVNWFDPTMQPQNPFLLQPEQMQAMILPDDDFMFEAGSELNIDMENEEGNEDQQLALAGDDDDLQGEEDEDAEGEGEEDQPDEAYY